LGQALFSSHFTYYLLKWSTDWKLKDKTFSQTVNGELNGKEYTFKTKGFIKQHTEIIDSLKNRD
jgi:hypothetical protein